MRTKSIIAISGLIIISTIAVMIYKSFNQSTDSKIREELFMEFKKDAENDIRNDNVKTFCFGFLIPPKTEFQKLEQVKTDSILKIYGLRVKNLGCTIMPELSKASEEYEKITEVYLTKRNGEGWRLKMENKIRKINKNYH